MSSCYEYRPVVFAVFLPQMSDSFHPMAQRQLLPVAQGCPASGWAVSAESGGGGEAAFCFQVSPPWVLRTLVIAWRAPGGVPAPHCTLLSSRVAWPPPPMRAHACGCPLSLLNLRSGLLVTSSPFITGGCVCGGAHPVRGRPEKQNRGFLEKGPALRKRVPPARGSSLPCGSDSPALRTSPSGALSSPRLFPWRRA